MRFHITKLSDRSVMFMELDELIKLIQSKNTDKITDTNWISHLQSIDYEVYLPKVDEVDFFIRKTTEEITMNRRCYRKTDKSVYQRKTELNNLRNQLIK